MERKYSILKNCFAGRAGYSLILNPQSQRAKRLLNGGFIEEVKEKEPPKSKKPKAAKREKKVVKPAETKA